MRMMLNLSNYIIFFQAWTIDISANKMEKPFSSHFHNIPLSTYNKLSSTFVMISVIPLTQVLH